MSDQGVALHRDGCLLPAVQGSTLCNLRKQVGATDWVPELTVAVEREDRKQIVAADELDVAVFLVKSNTMCCLERCSLCRFEWALGNQTPSACSSIMSTN